MDVLKWSNICPAGKQALVCFCLSAVAFTASLFSGSVLGHSSELWALTCWGPALYFCLFNFVLRYCYKGFMYEVSIRSAFLGGTFSLGLFLSTFDDGLKVFGWYTMILSMFHFSEFMAVALFNPKTLSVDSFILNHSVQYGVAAVSSWIEFAVEYYWFPSVKSHEWVSRAGVAMCVTGELFRKAAMWTARTNFTHTVQFERQAGHELVTRGVYALCRHPSYAGWLAWSVGTQLVLLNPLCLAAYGGASWAFFRARVLAEEMALVSFFGERYLQYRRRVPSGLPLVRGYSPARAPRPPPAHHWTY